jgi:hypothetical protein
MTAFYDGEYAATDFTDNVLTLRYVDDDGDKQNFIRTTIDRGHLIDSDLSDFALVALPSISRKHFMADKERGAAIMLDVMRALAAAADAKVDA